MATTIPRTRFAPSPTGLMHLGNIRTALMNYLFTKQRGGIFVLRIEDTDPQRNFDPKGEKIRKDLAWLGISYDEGPGKGGTFGPYIQSERANIYQEKLTELVNKGLAYRCFCTLEELDKKRQRQIALKQPPRYDRTCLKLSQDAISHNIDNKIPFIWRMFLDHSETVVVKEMARGTISFDLKHFSDFPLTRKDGSFTFMFANFIDDLTMEITHVIRGEDHLTNTAGQAALFKAFNAEIPTYWHMPILCNAEGRKLSKRDFGFSLHDLRLSGYLPQALCNYLSIIGGGSFEQEIMDLSQLTQMIDFDNIHTTGHVRYDIKKLTWINHKWINLSDPDKLTELCLPFLHKVYPKAKSVPHDTLKKMLQILKPELHTLKDCVQVLQFYFTKPQITQDEVLRYVSAADYDRTSVLIARHLPDLKTIDDALQFVTVLKQDAKKESLPLKSVFHFIRLALTGLPQGPTIHELITILGVDESKERLNKLL
jgi:glutamyl-tRNA synthetase